MVAPHGDGTSDTASAGLQVETIENVVPLDAQTGALSRKTVPDVLWDAVFGQPAPSGAEIEAAGGAISAVPPMRTYAILDAARITNLPEVLEDSELAHRCLFKGRAYDDLKNVAPWIVRLEDGNSFARNLFTRSDAYWHLWDNEAGIYMRSRASLDDMWRHFRKFTRIRDEAGKWLYFRFWEPRWAKVILRDMPPADAERFLSGIARIVAIDARGGGADVISRRSGRKDMI